MATLRRLRSDRKPTPIHEEKQEASIGKKERKKNHQVK
jgi:hypothetical protein